MCAYLYTILLCIEFLKGFFLLLVVPDRSEWPIEVAKRWKGGLHRLTECRDVLFYFVVLCRVFVRPIPRIRFSRFIVHFPSQHLHDLLGGCEEIAPESGWYQGGNPSMCPPGTLSTRDQYHMKLPPHPNKPFDSFLSPLLAIGGVYRSFWRWRADALVVFALWDGDFHLLPTTYHRRCSKNYVAKGLLSIHAKVSSKWLN